MTFANARRRTTTWLLALLGITMSGATPGVAAPQPPLTPAGRVATLVPGDGIRVRIYREPDLSGDYPVDDRGVVVLPKVGEWKVTDIPADSVRGALRAALKRFLATESIEITPFRRVAVTGAVLKPGLYPVDPTASVADAIILAGGAAPDARPRLVELRIAGADRGTPVSSELRVWDTAAGGTRQLYVPRRSWVQRNALPLYTLVISTVTTTFLLLQSTR